MKEIVNGRKYDTATARRLCGWSPDGDRATSETELFRKSTGEYFISRWHNLHGTNIVPLRREVAREFGERHMDADAYEAEFGPVGE